MATQADLDAAIAALPGNVATAVDASLKPVIDALIAKIGTITPPVDFQSEIDALNGVGAAVAAKVTADLTPPAPGA